MIRSAAAIFFVRIAFALTTHAQYYIIWPLECAAEETPIGLIRKLSQALLFFIELKQFVFLFFSSHSYTQCDIVFIQLVPPKDFAYRRNHGIFLCHLLDL